MKINELVSNDDLEEGIYGVDKRVILSNFKKDCIVAYDKNKLGSIFIFKGDKKSFAFFCINNELKYEMISGIVCRRISLSSAMKLLGDCNVLDKKEYAKITKEVLLDNLK